MPRGCLLTSQVSASERELNIYLLKEVSTLVPITHQESGCFVVCELEGREGVQCICVKPCHANGMKGRT